MQFPFHRNILPDLYKGKSKVVPLHAVKGEQLVQRHSLVSFSSGKEPRYPLNRRVGGPQSRSERFGEKNNLPCGGFESIVWLLYRPHFAGANLLNRRIF
jgi:hypothetical protein